MKTQKAMFVAFAILVIVISVFLVLVKSKGSIPEQQPVSQTFTQIQKDEIKTENPAEALYNYSVQSGEKVIFIKGLQGRKLADLYAFYLFGARDAREVGVKEKINFAMNLKKMWLAKRGIEDPENNVARKTALEIIGKFDQANIAGQVEKTTLAKYKKHVSGIVAELNRNMDWACFMKQPGRFSLDDSEIKMVKSIARTIKGRDLISYSLTELMPGRDGEIAGQMFQFLLENAGVEFLASIPAIYDDKTSMGMYQFTEYAVYDTPNEVRGASWVNRCLKSGQIPGSVSRLSSDDQHRAAWMFAVYNIAFGINKLKNEKQQKKAAEVLSNKKELLAYIAAAHHAPGPASSRTEERRVGKEC